MRRPWTSPIVAAIVAVLVLWTAHPGIGHARSVLDRVVAVVNDEVVLLSELRSSTERHPLLHEAMNQLPRNASEEQREQKHREVRAKVLDELIDKVLIRAEAEKFEITATAADVERALPNIAQSHGLTVEELKREVEASGEYGSWQEYREALRDDILQYKTVNFLATYQVTEAQIRDYYRKMTRDEQDKVVVQRFAFAPSQSTPEARDKAFAQAQVVARRLRSGDSAETLAEELRYDREVEETIGRGEIAPALEDAVFAAKPKQVVGPLASGQGYIVFKVLEHQAASALSFEEARPRIEEQLTTEALIKAEQEFKEQLRAKAHIDIRL